MKTGLGQTLARSFRRVGVPLLSYYAMTIVVPLMNGAAGHDSSFAEHATVVLILPPVSITIACAAHQLGRLVTRFRAASIAGDAFGSSAMTRQPREQRSAPFN